MIPLILFFHLFLLSQFKFTAWPEMFSFPYFLNSGLALYRDFVHIYPPLLTIALSLVFKIFGYKILVLKIFTWGLILLADVFVYLSIRQITKSRFVTYVILGIYICAQSVLDGNMLWFDNALVLPLVISAFFTISFLKNNRPRDLIFSTASLSMAILIKQSALVFFLPILFVVLPLINKLETKSKKIRVVISLFAPLVIGGLVLFVFLLLSGTLVDFYNWVIYYPLSFFSRFPGYVDYNLSHYQLMTLALGFVALAPIIYFWKRVVDSKVYLFVLLSLLAGLIGTFPRFSFFHMQSAIPFFVLLILIIHEFVNGRLAKYYLACVTIIFFVFFLNASARAWGGNVRFLEPKDVEFSRLLSEVVQPGSRIYLLNTNSLGYVLTSTLPPVPWVDNYGWYWEIPGVQKDTIVHWQSQMPEYIFVNDSIPGNWYDLGTYQPAWVVKWVKENYAKVGEIDKGVWIWKKK